MDKELSGLQTDIFDLAGEEFNVNSPRQLSTILFDKLALPVRKKTGKTRAASTSAAVLEDLAERHELPRMIVKWRAIQKLKGTYVDALPQLVRPSTSRVHTSFNQAVAATGRLSSSEPNLQNIPIRTPQGREIRRTFIAREGHVLISADYSQIELRVLAHLSADPTLIEAFVRGDDIHNQTAERVFGPNSGLEPHELRRRAKIINYALLYGKTAFTLSRDIGVPPKDAQAFIDAYFEGYPSVRGFLEAVVEQARESGEVRTMFGRRRLVPDLRSRNGQVRAAAERATVNMPIQGTSADILKRAMIDLANRLPPSAPMILTVHDELVLEVPADQADAVATLVRDRMSQAADLAVPLTVDVGIGPNWMEAKGWWDSSRENNKIFNNNNLNGFREFCGRLRTGLETQHGYIMSIRAGADNHPTVRAQHLQPAHRRRRTQGHPPAPAARLRDVPGRWRRARPPAQASAQGL